MEKLYPFQRFKRNQELRSAIIDGYAPALRSEAENVLLHMTKDFWDLLEACWGEPASRPEIGVVVDYLFYFERTLQDAIISLGQVAPPTPIAMESLMEIYKPVNLTGHIITKGPLVGRDLFVEVYSGFCNHIKVKAFRFICSLRSTFPRSPSKPIGFLHSGGRSLTPKGKLCSKLVMSF